MTFNSLELPSKCRIIESQVHKLDPPGYSQHHQISNSDFATKNQLAINSFRCFFFVSSSLFSFHRYYPRMIHHLYNDLRQRTQGQFLTPTVLPWLTFAFRTIAPLFLVDRKGPCHPIWQHSFFSDPAYLSLQKVSQRHSIRM
jgi:hypothetical protein